MWKTSFLKTGQILPDLTVKTGEFPHCGVTLLERYHRPDLPPLPGSKSPFTHVCLQTGFPVCGRGWRDPPALGGQWERELGPRETLGTALTLVVWLR